MKKSVASRIRITRTGKVFRRPMGVSHFRAKKSGRQHRRQLGFREFSSVDLRAVRRLMHSVLAI